MTLRSFKLNMEILQISVKQSMLLCLSIIFSITFIYALSHRIDFDSNNKKFLLCCLLLLCRIFSATGRRIRKKRFSNQIKEKRQMHYTQESVRDCRAGCLKERKHKNEEK